MKTKEKEREAGNRGRAESERPAFFASFSVAKKGRGNAGTRLFFCLRIQKHMINEPRTAAAREAEEKKKSPPVPPQQKSVSFSAASFFSAIFYVKAQ